MDDMEFVFVVFFDDFFRLSGVWNIAHTGLLFYDKKLFSAIKSAPAGAAEADHRAGPSSGERYGAGRRAKRDSCKPRQLRRARFRNYSPAARMPRRSPPQHSANQRRATWGFGRYNRRKQWWNPQARPLRFRGRLQAFPPPSALDD